MKFLAYGMYMNPDIFRETLGLKAQDDLKYDLVKVHGKRYFGAVDISNGIRKVFHENGRLKSKRVSVLTIDVRRSQDYNAVLYSDLPVEAMEERVFEVQGKGGIQ